MSDEKRMLSLPAPFAGSEAAIERPTVYQTHPEAPEAEPSIVPLSHYLWLLNRDKWKLLAFVVVVVASTVIVSSRMTPYYQSTATIDVDRMMPTGVIGQDADFQPRVCQRFRAVSFDSGEADPVRFGFAAGSAEV